MGSELRFRGEDSDKAYQDVAIWGEDLSVLFHFLIKDPSYLSKTLVATGIIKEIRIGKHQFKLIYGPLFDFLTKKMQYREGVDFSVFAYDWRRDVIESAAKLAAHVR